ncbi:MAG: isoprenylcysteine carboxylmethyltransferase family protein [Candidatus Margulisiibacteriota bacterium]
MNAKPKLTRSGYKRIIMLYGAMAAGAVIFFAAAGRFDLPRAWAYFLLSLFCQTVVFLLVFIRPEMAEVLNARGETHFVKVWDVAFVISYSLATLIVLPLVAGLDVGRFRWSELSLWWLAAGVIFYLLAILITEWALLENKFFETGVRVQKERGQTVISTGPYAIVRHPGYAGMILLYFSFPLIIGSFYTLLVSLFIALSLIVRTVLEEATLRQELAGYVEYTKKTRYRLIPFIW